jgi:hypothetical protein
MKSTISVANKFRSVLAEKELDHLEKMLRLSRTHGHVAHLNGAYWTARLTYVMEHFDLVAEQSKRVQALLTVSQRPNALSAKQEDSDKLGSAAGSWAA